MQKPNYQKIYKEIIQKKFPEKIQQSKKLLKKEWMFWMSSNYQRY